MRGYVEAKVIIENFLDIDFYKESFIVNLGRPIISREAVFKLPGALCGLLACQLET